MGNRKARRKIDKELENNPLKLCRQNMEEVNEIKFLGDYIGPSCKESIHITVSKRNRESLILSYGTCKDTSKEIMDKITRNSNQKRTSEGQKSEE